jgi:uncharacterized membrane protein
MSVLGLGLILFLGVHSARILGVRDAMARAMGEGLFALIYSVISAAGLALIVYGWMLALPTETLWNPPSWGRWPVYAITPLAFILLVAAYLPCHIRAVLRHPMTWAVALWAGSHLLASNGGKAHALLFGGFLAWALVLLISAYLRGGHFAHQGRWAYDALAVVLGLGAALAMALLHMQFFAVAVIDPASVWPGAGI